MATTRRALLVSAATFLTLGIAFSYAGPQSERIIKVRARRFVFTPNQIALKVGEPTIFELSTEEVLMGFSIPDFGVRADIVPGRSIQLAVTPQNAGTFDFLCDIFCGSGHEQMNGQITVA